MPGELLFHLGFAKAGSTAIQRAFAAGAVRCPTRTLDYPEPETHLPFAMSLRPRVRFAARRRHHRTLEMAERLRRSEADLTLVSAEAFENVPPRELHRFLRSKLPRRAGRVRLIAYVRPHVERTVSAFAERTKQGDWHGTLAEHHARTLARGNSLAWRRLSNWRDAFGEALTVRPAIRGRLHEGSVVHDLARWAFGDEPFEVDPLPEENASLSLRDLAVLAEIHREMARRGPVREGERVSLGWRMQEILAAMPEDAPVRVAPDRALAARMQADFAEDAARIDEAFMDGTPMQDALARAPERVADRPQEMDPAAHMTPAELRTVRALARHLADRIAAARPADEPSDAPEAADETPDAPEAADDAPLEAAR